MKVKMDYDLISDSINFYFYYEDGNGVRRVVKPVKLETVEVKKGMPVSGPTMSIPYPEAGQFMDSMAEALDEQGVKTDKDSKIIGTLEATRYHLEDMRKILKVDK
jgi:hypothetical protein